MTLEPDNGKHIETVSLFYTLFLIIISKHHDLLSHAICASLTIQCLSLMLDISVSFMTERALSQIHRFHSGEKRVSTKIVYDSPFSKKTPIKYIRTFNVVNLLVAAFLAFHQLACLIHLVNIHEDISTHQPGYFMTILYSIIFLMPFYFDYNSVRIIPLASNYYSIVIIFIMFASKFEIMVIPAAALIYITNLALLTIEVITVFNVFMKTDISTDKSLSKMIRKHIEHLNCVKEIEKFVVTFDSKCHFRIDLIVNCDESVFKLNEIREAVEDCCLSYSPEEVTIQVKTSI